MITIPVVLFPLFIKRSDSESK